MSKRGIVIASFGTSFEDTRKKCIETVENRIKEEFKYDYSMRAFTSRIIIGILEKRDNIYINTPEEAVEEMKEQGIKHIYIQPLHIIRGHEYEGLLDIGVKVARPLLSNDKDYKDLVNIVNSNDLEEDQALILMGHGTDHQADKSYDKLQAEYIKAGYKNIFIGTVEGSKDIQDIIKELDRTKYKKVILQPLMLVAGDHAKNDMASDDKDSWKSILEKNGYKVEVRLKGLGEYPAIADMYIEHLKDIMGEE